MPWASLSQAATWPAVRQRPAWSPAWSCSCTLGWATGLGLPGGASRSKSLLKPPAVKSSSQIWMVDRARPANWASASRLCWPLVAQSTTCNRSLSRGSPADRIACLICASSSWLMLNLVRFLAMPHPPTLTSASSTLSTDCYYDLVLYHQRLERLLPGRDGRQLQHGRHHWQSDERADDQDAQRDDSVRREGNHFRPLLHGHARRDRKRFHGGRAEPAFDHDEKHRGLELHLRGRQRALPAVRTDAHAGEPLGCGEVLS